MALSSFVIRLIFLTIPGIVSVLLYRTLKGRPAQKDWEDILEIGVFSLLSYSLCGLFVDIINLTGWVRWEVSFFHALLDDTISLSWYEIYAATFVGVVLAFIAARLHTQNVVNRLGQWLHVSSMFGNKDVWDFFQKQYSSTWVFVRDHKLNLTYFGYILAYSDSEKERELILQEVDVYQTSDSKFLYTTPTIYISRSRDDLSIELPLPMVGSEEHVAQSTREKSNEQEAQVTRNANYNRGAFSQRTGRKGRRKSTS